MMRDDQIKILMRLHELEECLGTMYVQLSEKFPEHNGLWRVLIKEEQEHADAVRKLYQLSYQKKVLFNEGVLKVAGIQTIIDYLKNVCESAQRDKLTALQALTIAHDVEKSLIEKSLFDHFKVAPEFENLLDVLRDGSYGHIDLTKRELDKALRKQKGQ